MSSRAPADNATSASTPRAFGQVRKRRLAGSCPCGRDALPSAKRQLRGDTTALHRSAAVQSANDLPEGVLAADLAVTELEQIAPAYLDGLACDLRAADRPLRDSLIAADPVAIVAVPDVRDPLESGLDSRSNLVLAHQPPPARCRPAGHVKYAVLGEEGHDRVDVVGVERV